MKAIGIGEAADLTSVPQFDAVAIICCSMPSRATPADGPE